MSAPSFADYDYWNDIWPAGDKGRIIAPVRVGMNRQTGKMMVGFDHVLQSMEDLFQTRFHTRELREWVGSYVPHLLGDNATGAVITRFWFAFATGLELWEPCYRVAKISLLGDPQNGVQGTTVEAFRQGHVTFKFSGVYMPRGHLGDFTPEAQRGMLLRGRGNNSWEASAT